MKKQHIVICPDCSAENDYKSKECTCCGRILKKGTNLKKLTIILSVILGLLALGLCINQVVLHTSNNNYKMAQKYEENFEYESAISYYSKVISWDTKNYSLAQEKINTINETITEYKLCARGILAASSSPYFNNKTIKEIYFATPDSSFSFTYGKDAVAIVSTYMSTDCCYIISERKSPFIEESFPISKDSYTGLYVHQIGVENYQKGWLSSGWDTVTNSYITQAKNSCTLMNIECVNKYLDEYYKNKNLDSISRLEE